MVQEQTILKVADNSGAKTVRCIKVIGGFKKKYARIGDTIIVSVQQLRNKSKKNSKVKKKEIYRAFILKTAFWYKDTKGFKFFFKKNAVALLDKQNNPIATRILGFLPKIFRKKKFQKFISISTGLV